MNDWYGDGDIEYEIRMAMAAVISGCAEYKPGTKEIIVSNRATMELDTDEDNEYICITIKLLKNNKAIRKVYWSNDFNTENDGLSFIFECKNGKIHGLEKSYDTYGDLAWTAKWVNGKRGREHLLFTKSIDG